MRTTEPQSRTVWAISSRIARMLLNSWNSRNVVCRPSTSPKPSGPVAVPVNALSACARSRSTSTSL